MSDEGMFSAQFSMRNVQQETLHLQFDHSVLYIKNSFCLLLHPSFVPCLAVHYSLVRLHPDVHALARRHIAAHFFKYFIALLCKICSRNGLAAPWLFYVGHIYFGA